MFNLAPTFPLLASAIPAFIGAIAPPSRTDRLSRFGFSYILAMSVVALLQSSINSSKLHLHVLVTPKVAVPYFLFILFHFTVVLILFTIYNFALRLDNTAVRITTASLLFASAFFCGAHAAFIPQIYPLGGQP